MRSFVRMVQAPDVVESGVDQEVLLTGGCGHTLEVWDLATRRRLTTLDLGAEHRILPGLRPVHDAAEPYGFVGVLTSFADRSASVWLWHRRVIEDTLDWAVRKVIEIPAEP